ncbi:SipW-dependent-type signal peptide-containing protein [Nesterenkonia sp. YGD6]|uniref:SipW-dependent-type signal peptide-containing protein n=1 Tax=Nesterenkonia sp. YGD6 TaxID=2901231 RepID=UPI001F4CAEFC|nr:SipW-dependent-type signal peptide-containing protein [Nesterenkonia sp. YGD6]MCH8564052.1 SipW-dependent-type signal peptide-containing protein [Nesterenkonia sp. YGD6]
MTATPPASRPETFESQTRAHSRRRKIKAVVAAGTVLGIGAVATLATWNDSEFAQGLFGAGSYSVESSNNGESFGNHGSKNRAATLSFGDLNAANAAPGDEFAAEFWLRTTPESTYAGRITQINLVDDSAEGQYENFRDVEVWHVDEGSSCTTGTVQGTVVASGDHLGDLTSAINGGIPLSYKNEAAGDAVQLCFQATATDSETDGVPDLRSGVEARATWSIETESTHED